MVFNSLRGKIPGLIAEGLSGQPPIVEGIK
jgi:hypothetical protein